jgi:phosphatidylserine decarboxylase
LIDTNPLLRMHVQRMIDEVPATRAYRQRHLRSVEQLLQLINAVLTTAPEFGQDAMVATPIGAILDWTMGTPAGFAAYRDPRIIAALKEILDAWAAFLDSPDSLYVLNDSPNGWKSAQARRAVGIDQFEYDPQDEHWGFTSWNDFFTRRFRPGVRPIAAPDDDAVVVSACEATPYALTTGVRRTDRFWVKSEPYSVADMLAHDPATDAFVGGTVFQAFLSAINYHRWHSPVAGTIVRAFRVPGTYYSEADSQGSDAVEPTHSQAYLAHVATRAVVLIQADDPMLGLVTFVPVGMSDVSSCLLHPDLVPGRHVAKGDELGRFQYGGSTCCLLFRPGSVAEFDLAALPRPHDREPPLLRMGAALARAARG